jgi:hypothetical protein
MLKIILQEFEENKPGKGNWYYLRGEYNAGDFSGWSHFVLSESDFHDFIEELKLFSVKFEGSPKVSTGWGDEIYFSLQIEKWKKTGTLWASGELAYHVYSKTISDPPCSHRVVFGFPLEPSQLDSFASGLTNLRNQRGNEAILNGIKN